MWIPNNWFVKLTTFVQKSPGDWWITEGSDWKATLSLFTFRLGDLVVGVSSSFSLPPHGFFPCKITLNQYFMPYDMMSNLPNVCQFLETTHQVILAWIAPVLALLYYLVVNPINGNSLWSCYTGHLWPVALQPLMRWRRWLVLWKIYLMWRSPGKSHVNEWMDEVVETSWIFDSVDTFEKIHYKTYTLF